jgi:hypothetical protein
MSVFRFDPIELPPECEALRGEVRAFIADELAAGSWVPNSDFLVHPRLSSAGGSVRAAGSA